MLDVSADPNGSLSFALTKWIEKAGAETSGFESLCLHGFGKVMDDLHM